MRYDSLDQSSFGILLNTDVIAVIELAYFFVPKVQSVIPAVAYRALVCLRDCLDLPTSTAWYLALEPHNSRDSKVTRIGLQLHEVLTI